MRVQSVLDPDGAQTRKSRRLKRRVYMYKKKGPNYMCGMLMDTTNSAHFASIHGCTDG
jgi:hypothetical protein